MNASHTCLVAALAAGCVIANCAVSAIEVEASGTDEQASTSNGSYLLVRRDVRKCASPKCGGYWLTDLNRERAEIYVSRLEIAPAEPTVTLLEQADIDGVPDRALIIRGRLGASDVETDTQPFVVVEAYRGMPGIVVDAHASYFKVSAPGDQAGGSAHLLNSSKSKDVRGVDVSGAAQAWVDEAWLRGRILRENAIVAGGFSDTELAARQVFVRVPDRVGPCEATPIPASCASDAVAVFTRDANRCLLPKGCSPPGMCPMLLPVCAPGYVLRTWMTGAVACPSYACDPSFVEPSVVIAPGVARGPNG